MVVCAARSAGELSSGAEVAHRWDDGTRLVCDWGAERMGAGENDGRMRDAVFRSTLADVPATDATVRACETERVHVSCIMDWVVESGCAQ
jgi:hypothetical protein